MELQEEGDTVAHATILLPLLLPALHTRLHTHSTHMHLMTPRFDAAGMGTETASIDHPTLVASVVLVLVLLVLEVLVLGLVLER